MIEIMSAPVVSTIAYDSSSVCQKDENDGDEEHVQNASAEDTVMMAAPTSQSSTPLSASTAPSTSRSCVPKIHSLVVLLSTMIESREDCSDVDEVLAKMIRRRNDNNCGNKHNALDISQGENWLQLPQRRITNSSNNSDDDSNEKVNCDDSSTKSSINSVRNNYNNDMPRILSSSSTKTMNNTLQNNLWLLSSTEPSILDDDTIVGGCFLCLDVDGTYLTVKDMRTSVTNDDDDDDGYTDWIVSLQRGARRRSPDNRVANQKSSVADADTISLLQDLEQLPLRQLRVLYHMDRIVLQRRPISRNNSEPKKKQEQIVILQYRYDVSIFPSTQEDEEHSELLQPKSNTNVKKSCSVVVNNDPADKTAFNDLVKDDSDDDELIDLGEQCSEKYDDNKSEEAVVAVVNYNSIDVQGGGGDGLLTQPTTTSGDEDDDDLLCDSTNSTQEVINCDGKKHHDNGFNVDVVVGTGDVLIQNNNSRICNNNCNEDEDDIDYMNDDSTVDPDEPIVASAKKIQSPKDCTDKKEMIPAHLFESSDVKENENDISSSTTERDSVVSSHIERSGKGKSDSGIMVEAETKVQNESEVEEEVMGELECEKSHLIPMNDVSSACHSPTPSEEMKEKNMKSEGSVDENDGKTSVKVIEDDDDLKHEMVSIHDRCDNDEVLSTPPTKHKVNAAGDETHSTTSDDDNNRDDEDFDEKFSECLLSPMAPSYACSDVLRNETKTVGPDEKIPENGDTVMKTDPMFDSVVDGSATILANPGDESLKDGGNAVVDKEATATAASGTRADDHLSNDVDNFRKDVSVAESKSSETIDNKSDNEDSDTICPVEDDRSKKKRSESDEELEIQPNDASLEEKVNEARKEVREPDALIKIALAAEVMQTIDDGADIRPTLELADDASDAQKTDLVVNIAQVATVTVPTVLADEVVQTINDGEDIRPTLDLADNSSDAQKADPAMDIALDATVTVPTVLADEDVQSIDNVEGIRPTVELADDTSDGQKADLDIETTQVAAVVECSQHEGINEVTEGQPKALLEDATNFQRCDVDPRSQIDPMGECDTHVMPVSVQKGDNTHRIQTTVPPSSGAPIVPKSEGDMESDAVGALVDNNSSECYLDNKQSDDGVQQVDRTSNAKSYSDDATNMNSSYILSNVIDPGKDAHGNDACDHHPDSLAEDIIAKGAENSLTESKDSPCTKGNSGIQRQSNFESSNIPVQSDLVESDQLVDSADHSSRTTVLPPQSVATSTRNDANAKDMQQSDEARSTRKRKAKSQNIDENKQASVADTNDVSISTSPSDVASKRQSRKRKGQMDESDDELGDKRSAPDSVKKRALRIPPKSEKKKQTSPLHVSKISEEVRLVVTGFEFTAAHKKMLKKINGVLLESVESAHTATHVIVTDGTGPIRRTPKLMIAFCRTCNIVTLDWLVQSARVGNALPCAPFFALGDEKAEKQYNFSLEKTIARIQANLKNETYLLSGRAVYVCKGVAGNKAPPENELRLIVEAAGGTWLSSLTSPSKDGKNSTIIIVTSDPEPKKQVSSKDVTAALKGGAAKKTTSWLFRATMTQQLDV